MYKVAQVMNDEVTETGLMLAADFDALALSLGQPIPLPGCMPAWAEQDVEAQQLFVKIKKEFPQLSDECAWEILTVSDGPGLV